jgi:hypothetical protein
MIVHRKHTKQLFANETEFPLRAVLGASRMLPMSVSPRVMKARGDEGHFRHDGRVRSLADD